MKKDSENRTKFTAKDLRKVIIDKSHLRNKFIENGTNENWH